MSTSSADGSRPAAPPVPKWLPWAAAALIGAVVLMTGVVAHVKAKVILAGAVTLTYDPIAGKLAVSADPLHLASKWVSVKLGDEIPLTPDEDKVMVVVDTVMTRAAFQVPVGGNWSIRATDFVGDRMDIDYDGDERRFHIDMAHVYLKSLVIKRTEGANRFETQPLEETVPTHPLIVDTSLLTAGDFTYCSTSTGKGDCGLYLHAIANLSPTQRVQSRSGDPVRVPNGASVRALCEAGGARVSNDASESSTKWEYVIFDGYVGYLPAIWTGSANSAVVRPCGS